MNTLQDALVFVFNADDRELDRLRNAIQERAKQLRVINKHEALATFKRGDRVELHSLSPKYLNGATGIIQALEGTRFQVVLDDDVDYRVPARYGKTVSVPANCLKEVT
jgi:ribosomal protein L21E